MALTEVYRKSSYSTGANNCVEARATSVGVDVRDTKDRGRGPVLTFSPEAWRAFLSDVPTPS